MISKFGQDCGIDESVPFECVACVARPTERMVFAVEPADSLRCRGIAEWLLLPRVRRQRDATAGIGPGNRFKIDLGSSHERFRDRPFERIVIRPVEKAPPLTVVLVTLGLFFVINGLAGLIWSYVIKPFPGPPGFPQTPISFGGVSLGLQDLFLIGTTVVLLAILYVFFTHTKLGLAMRAAASR